MSDNTNTSSGWGRTERRIWLGLFALLLAGIGTAQFMIIDALDKQTKEVSSIESVLGEIEEEIEDIGGLYFQARIEEMKRSKGIP